MEQISYVRVKGTRSLYALCELNLPSHVREELTEAELEKTCGRFLLGFYFQPAIGTSFDYRGFIWRVEAIHESVKRYGEHGDRFFPCVTCSFIGRLAAD